MLRDHRHSLHRSAIRTWAVAFLLLLLTLPSSPALARTALEQKWAPYNDWQLDFFKLEGVPAGLKDELKSGLAMTGQRRLLRRRRLPLFHTRLLGEDIARIRLFLAKEGFPAAAITPEAFPVPGKRSLGVTFHIDPGPVVLVTDVQYHGWPESIPPPRTKAKESFRKGDRFRDEKIETSKQFLRRYLQDNGCALANITAAVKPIDPTSVAVIYTVTSAEIYQITEVRIAGGSEDLRKLTRRLVNMKPPLPFSQKRLDRAGFDLRATQLYSQVVFTTEPVGPDQLRLTTAVENARMRTLETSIGTWSDNPWAVRAGWRHRNLFEGGKGLDLNASFATHTQSAGAGMTWFGWMTPSARTRVGFEWLREDEDAYLSDEKRVDLTQNLRPKPGDLSNVGISLSRIDLETYTVVDTKTADHLGTLLEIWADRKWDWTDDPLYPTRGGFSKVSITWAPPVPFSDSPYVSLQADMSLYRKLLGRTVVAGRVRTGWAQSLGDAPAVIPNRRFFAGGYSTMRGYGRRQLGPRDSEGVAMGGDLVVLAGLEARVPVVWIIDVAVFLDSGQVWWQPTDIRLDEIEVAPGVSLDLRTPLGPVRLGYAWNLTDVYPGQPESLAHFGVGYPW
jgi:outer membrane protein assembly factor BamA